MSLHKELTLAFREREALRPAGRYGRGGTVVVGDIEEGNAPAKAQSGFSWRRIDSVLVINPAGEVMNVEQPPWHPRGKQRRTSMLVPQGQLRIHRGFSGFLWGGSLHALGLQRWSGQGEVRGDADAFHSFRTFHNLVIDETRDPSLRAFLCFLQNWQPERAANIRQLAPVVGGSVAFRFQYDEYFLHESHAARLIWSRLLSSCGECQEPTEAA